MNSTMFHIMISRFSRLCKRCLVLTSIGLSVAASAFPQEINGLNAVNNLLQTYASAYAQQERLFVFLNSGFYYPGENIAFKAVLFDTEMKIKGNGSRFFYLQLVNGSGTAIGNYTYELHSGECSGTVKIPDTLVTGLYTLRAYTRWMQNYNPANCFRRPVLVISPLGGTLLQTTLCDSLAVRFYPEGGRLVSGIENSMLVRMNPCQHESIKQLRITDDLGHTLLTFSLDPGGKAVFSFIPEPGRRYNAVAADSGKPELSFDLPEPQSGGYGMHIGAGRDSLHIRIAVSGETAPGQSLILAILTGNAGNSVVMPVAPFHNSTTVSFPLDVLPAGISQVALFANNSLLCSRVWYRESGRVAVKITDLTDTLGTRKSVIAPFSLVSIDSQYSLLAVSLNESNAITDSIVFDEISFFRYFELYSSLPDPEKLPVLASSASEREINDCLMASAKSLPMDFAIKNTGKPRYEKEELGVVLSGKVVHPSTLEPVKGATILLSYPDSMAYMNYSETNDEGEFFFLLNEKLYNRKVFIIAQGYPQDKNPVTIVPDDPFLLSSAGEDAAVFEHPGAASLISGHQNIAMAFRVFYAGRDAFSAPVMHKYQSYRENFYGKPDYTLVPAEYESLPDLFEIRKNLFPLLKLKVKDDYCLITVFDEYMQLFFPQEAFVLLNNIPYPSFKNILELNSDIIQSIEMKNRKFFYDNYIMYGIVSIKTRKPVEVVPHYSYQIASVNVMPEKMEIPLEKEINAGTLPDLRHSLYWRTDRVSLREIPGIHFRTSDIRGNYRLKIYAVDSDGKLQVTDKVFIVL